MGSGTTPVACVETNRHYIGFEISEEYYNIACKRLDEAKGMIKDDCDYNLKEVKE